MKNIFIISILTIMISGCCISTTDKAYIKYVKIVGPQYIKYSEHDNTLKPEVLKARKDLQKAAMILVNAIEKK